MELAGRAIDGPASARHAGPVLLQLEVEAQESYLLLFATLMEISEAQMTLLPKAAMVTACSCKGTRIAHF